MERPALEVADIFRRYGGAYREAHGFSISQAQRRVMRAIEQCRTAALGGHVEQCDRCAHRRIAYNSCANRHCPKCQSLAKAQWLDARRAELLPVEYHHVVFTLPEEIAAIAYQNQAAVYGLFFRAAAKTLQTLAADPKHLGAELGFIAVLHTWGQTLLYHPHLHCIVPGGGLSLDGHSWVSCRSGFFLPVRVLSRLFRRVFLDALQTAFDTHQLQFFASLQSHVEFQRKLYTPGTLTGRVRTATMLSDEDYQEAVRRYKNMRVNGHERQRYHALILVHQGYSYREVGRILLVDEETIRRWVDQYQERGLAGLQNHPAVGRGARATGVKRRARRELAADTAGRGDGGDADGQWVDEQGGAATD